MHPKAWAEAIFSCSIPGGPFVFLRTPSFEALLRGISSRVRRAPLLFPLFPDATLVMLGVSAAFYFCYIMTCGEPRDYVKVLRRKCNNQVSADVSTLYRCINKTRTTRSLPRIMLPFCKYRFTMCPRTSLRTVRMTSREMMPVEGNPKASYPR